MASSIVSYGGAATSTFLPTPTPPFHPFGSNFVKDRINSCASSQVEKIKKKLDREDIDGYKGLEESRRGALFCRSGTWLEMIPTAFDDTIHVHGTHDENSKFSIVEFISVAMSLVSIRGVETKHFICMDPTGRLYATPSSNYSSECVFIEEMMENYYNSYASCVYSNKDNPWYIELRRSGKPRKGPNTRKRRKASHFLVVHHDFNRLHHPTHPNGNDVSDLVVASLYHRPPSHPMFRPNSRTTPEPVARISRLRAKVQTTVDEEERKLREVEEKKRRREKKKRRREERLMREEKRRRERRLELSRLRAQELRQSRSKPKPVPIPNPYATPTYLTTTSSPYPSYRRPPSNTNIVPVQPVYNNYPYNNSRTNISNYNSQNYNNAPVRQTYQPSNQYRNSYSPPTQTPTYPPPATPQPRNYQHHSHVHHHNYPRNNQEEPSRITRSDYYSAPVQHQPSNSQRYYQNVDRNSYQNPNPTYPPYPYSSNYQRRS